MKNRDDSNYRRLMELRERDPKRFGLTSLAVEYEDVRKYSRNQKMDMEEMKWKISRFSERISEVMKLYKLSMEEIADYFRSHNYSLDFV